GRAGKPTHDPAGAAQPPRGLVSPARLDLAKDREHFWCGDFGYGALADCRIGKVEQPALLGESHVGASLPLELDQQLFGNGPEGVATRRRQLFQPALHGGIDIIAEQSLGLVAFLARVLQRHRGIDADGQRLLFSAKPVSQSPQLAAVWLDQQMKPAAVRELDRTVGRLRVADPSVVEHVGIVRSIPTKIPTNRAATNTSPRTVADRPTREMPAITGLFGLQRTNANNCERRSGAPGRTRTSTMLPPPDFESGASTNSATGACARSERRGGEGHRPHTIAAAASLYGSRVKQG